MLLKHIVISSLLVWLHWSYYCYSVYQLALYSYTAMNREYCYLIDIFYADYFVKILCYLHIFTKLQVDRLSSTDTMGKFSVS
jgi:hypothetical protein